MHEKLKKKYGQNFLKDKNVLNKIYNLINHNSLIILEIGPGNGNLTEYILKTKPSKLILVEIDRDLIPNLESRFIEFKNILIYNSDILKSDEIFNINYDLIISNLPYNISSQVLIKLCLLKLAPKRMILMFQKEFANKLLEKNLNSLNSLIKCFYSIQKKFDISKNSFFPIPKVDSTILEFKKLNLNYIKDEDILDYITFKRKIFSKKRKSINTILKLKDSNFTKDFLMKRAENFTLEEFVNLFNKINS